MVEADQCAAQPAGRDFLSAAQVGADPGDGDLARARRRLEDPADLPRLHDPGHDRGLQRRAVERADAGVVGAQHGRQSPPHTVGRGAAERDARTAQRHPHRAGAVVHPAGVVRADRGARGLRPSDRLPRRERRL